MFHNLFSYFPANTYSFFPIINNDCFIKQSCIYALTFNFWIYDRVPEIFVLLQLALSWWVVNLSIFHFRPLRFVLRSCLFMSFAHFSIGLVFLYYKNYIGNISPLSSIRSLFSLNLCFLYCICIVVFSKMVQKKYWMAFRKYWIIMF